MNKTNKLVNKKGLQQGWLLHNSGKSKSLVFFLRYTSLSYCNKTDFIFKVKKFQCLLFFYEKILKKDEN